MRRRIFTAISAVSLLACLTFIAIWPFSYDIRSFWLTDPLGGLRFQSHGHVWAACFAKGNLVVEHFLPDVNAHLADRQQGWHFAEVLGYRYFEGGFQRWSYTVVALWLITVITAFPPAVWLATEITRCRRKRIPSSCPNCLYDLTGNTSGTSPECGSPATPAKTPELFDLPPLRNIGRQLLSMMTYESPVR